MRHLKLFENFNREYITDILGELCDTIPNLVKYTHYSNANIYWNENEDILLYHLDTYYESEFESSNSRLKDIGYQILQVSKNYTKGWCCTIIKCKLYDKLKDNDILFWSDLKWTDWHMNQAYSMMGSTLETKHCRIRFDDVVKWNDEGSHDISIVDGKMIPQGEERIEFNVSIGDREEFVFYDKCEAEICLITLQMEYFNLK